MRYSFAPRSGVEYVEKDGAYVQTYPEPVKPEPLADWEKELLGYVKYVEKDGTYVQVYPEPEPDPAPWGVFAPQGGLPLFIFATEADAKAKVEVLNAASLTGGFAYGQAGIDW